MDAVSLGKQKFLGLALGEGSPKMKKGDWRSEFKWQVDPRRDEL